MQDEFPHAAVPQLALLARDVRVLRGQQRVRPADEHGRIAYLRHAVLNAAVVAYWRPEHLRERERERVCVCVLTQWGATLVIQLREREREREGERDWEI